MKISAWIYRVEVEEIFNDITGGTSLIKLNSLDWLLKIIWTQPGRIGFLQGQIFNLDNRGERNLKYCQWQGRLASNLRAPTFIFPAGEIQADLMGADYSSVSVGRKRLNANQQDQAALE